MNSNFFISLKKKLVKEEKLFSQVAGVFTENVLKNDL